MHTMWRNCTANKGHVQQQPELRTPRVTHLIEAVSEHRQPFVSQVTDQVLQQIQLLVGADADAPLADLRSTQRITNIKQPKF